MYNAQQLNDLFTQMSPRELAKAAIAVEDEFESRCIDASQAEYWEIARCRTEIADHFLSYATPQNVYDRCKDHYGKWEEV